MNTEHALFDWREGGADRLEDRPLTLRHRLCDLPMFAESALVELLERHPRDALHVNTMGGTETEREWREGELGDLSGEHVLEAVRRGMIWINFRRVTVYHDEYRKLVDALYDTLEANCDGFRARSRKANLLLSSPNAKVFFHADAPPNMLWHLWGRKRAWVYPAGDPRFVSPLDMESIYMGEAEEEIPYRPEFDEHAEVFDVTPGDMLTWPQNAPHRIENGGELALSLSTEHYTPLARRRLAIQLANGWFRRKLGWNFTSTSTRGPAAVAKAAAIIAVRKLGLYSVNSFEPTITFRLDPEAPNGIVDIPPKPAGG